MVFEPSYALGCLATLSSLARNASAPLSVDILLRSEYRAACERIVARLRREHGGKLRVRLIPIPSSILAACDAYRFRSHFIAEVLFRLFYFELVDDHGPLVIYMDVDMMVLRDIFSIREYLTAALLHAVEAKLFPRSRSVTPPHITRYLNSGFLVFNAADRQAVVNTMQETRAVVSRIADRAEYLDQDAINIAFHDHMTYLPKKWNFTLEDFDGAPLPSDIVVLHATGSRKPWFFLGHHPFRAWYEQEADALRLSWFARFDFVWTLRRMALKIGRLVDAR